MQLKSFRTTQLLCARYTTILLFSLHLFTVGLGKCMQPWWFLFLDLLGEKLSDPGEKEGKASQKLCTLRGRPRPQGAPHLWLILSVF